MIRNLLSSGIKTLAICIFPFWLFPRDVDAQQLLYEFELGKLDAKNLKGVVSGDSIFLSFLQSRIGSMEDPKYHSMWVSSKGQGRQIDLDELQGKYLAGISAARDTTRYYFFEEATNNSVLLRCLNYDERWGKKTIAAQTATLPGRLLGSYIESDDLYLICASKKDYRVRLIRIHGTQVVNEKIFNLAGELVKKKNTRVAFIQEGETVTPYQASASVKIVKASDGIYISIDEFYDANAIKQGMFKTTVMKLDLNSESVSTRVFFEPSMDYFNSMTFGGHLYRVKYESRYLKLEIFNLANGKLVTSKIFNEPKGSILANVYNRDGSNKTTTKYDYEKGYKKMVGYPFVIPDSVSGKSLIAAGLWMEDDVNIPMITTLGVLPALLSGIASVLVRDLYEGPINCSYFYLRTTAKNSIEYDAQIPSARKMIDEYEALNAESKFMLKGYLNGKNATYAIYQRNKSNKLEVWKFDKP